MVTICVEETTSIIFCNQLALTALTYVNKQTKGEKMKKEDRKSNG